MFIEEGKDFSWGKMTDWENILHVGIDDVDSPFGGCTTHLSLIIAKKLIELGNVFIDYPNLVRLNPGVPWKTRGNGAVALRFISNMGLSETSEIIEEIMIDYIKQYKNPKHQPCFIVVKGQVNHNVVRVAKKALHDIVPVDLALKSLEGSEHIIKCFHGNRGVVGALGAIGNTMEHEDYTYELLAYRKSENLEKDRCVDKESIILMDKVYKGETILNYDPRENRVLILPGGFDPVLLGIRGESPSILTEAFRMLKLCEEADFAAIFRTNQHTDAHIRSVASICYVRPYMCVRVRGEVSSKPVRLIGGHVFFKLCDSDCCIDVAAYEPTKWFREIVELLEPGDVVEAQGCVRPPSTSHGSTLNLEKLRVVSLKPKFLFQNPTCPRCGKRLKSAGRGKGFKCEKCGFRSKDSFRKIIIVERGLSEGWYQPPYSAFKHMMKPLERMGKEKNRFIPHPIGSFFVG